MQTLQYEGVKPGWDVWALYICESNSHVHCNLSDCSQYSVLESTMCCVQSDQLPHTKCKLCNSSDCSQYSVLGSTLCIIWLIGIYTTQAVPFIRFFCNAVYWTVQCAVYNLINCHIHSTSCAIYQILCNAMYWTVQCAVYYLMNCHIHGTSCAIYQILCNAVYWIVQCAVYNLINCHIHGTSCAIYYMGRSIHQRYQFYLTVHNAVYWKVQCAVYNLINCHTWHKLCHLLYGEKYPPEIPILFACSQCSVLGSVLHYNFAKKCTTDASADHTIFSRTSEASEAETRFS